MHKYERQCWSCGSKDMEDKGAYVQCRSCGATWNVVPTLGPDPRAGKSSDVNYLRAIGRIR